MSANALGASTRRRSRVLRHMGVGVALAAGLIPTVLTGQGSASSPSPTYEIQGTVTNTSAQIPSADPTVPSNSTAFSIQVTQSASDLSAYESNGQLTIQTDPETTTFYAQGSTGSYTKSNYEGTVVQGATVQVYGHYVTGPGGTTFTAVYVWNPPPPPTQPGSTGQVPACGMSTGHASRPFLIEATVQNNRVDLPCTGAGGYPLGFTAENPVQESAGTDAAFQAYGGILDIYAAPYTKYAYGNSNSTWGQVVAPGSTVWIWGNYFYANGTWLFIAKFVWASPPSSVTSPPQGPRTESANVVAAQSPPGSATYFGPLSGSGFSGMSYSGTWSCSPDTDTVNDPGGTIVSGWWSLSSSSNSVGGSMSGSISASGSMNIGLTIENGSGYYLNTQGGGSLTGTAPVTTPGMCPASLSGTISLTYVFVTS